MLTISPEKVCFIIIKAREFDAKVDPVEPDPASDGADDGEREILEDYADDATAEELRSVLTACNVDELADLVALTWIGRGDYDGKQWDNARGLAGERATAHGPSYLMETPLLGDYLEEGLSQLGYSCEDYELGHL
ncbi:MAG: hypothetical protein CMM50_08415 [Rhodospirillaceae bacterium]|nr:hypothetical protein [Rhodospirillaceae bacterium]|tara:strand:+ start:706 stop:1110 length:405 start_codon:yes stop_codon:yes gene_type:complete